MNPATDKDEDKTARASEQVALSPHDADQNQETTDLNAAKPYYGKVSEAWHNFTDATQKLFVTARHKSIKSTPSVVVNNSSNILGAAHVMTELVMFKASIKDGKLVDKHNYWDFLPKALIKVYRDAFSTSKNSTANPVELLKGNPVKNVWEFVTDTKKATEREFAAQMKQGVAVENVKLGNRWQTRSTLAGLTVWGLSALIPDKKESDEEVERMEIMRRTNLPKYVAERFRQAVWFPGWPDHKRQMIGLGIMTSGICSTIGAWRNRDKLAALPRYKLNPSYLATSAITFMASLPLLFASDDSRGFGWFGGIMTGRLAFLPTSIWNKFSAKEDGAWSYLLGMTGFQLENWTQALIGGAEKKPDGSIVDHSAIHKSARDKARAIKENHHHSEALMSAVPVNTLTSVERCEPAMPDRVEARQHEMA
jgi:hypothetical protein